MQKITVLCVGKIKQSMYQEAIQDFTHRLEKHVQFSVIELPDSKQTDIPKKQYEETESLKKFIRAHPSTYIILDEHGATMNSHKFSDLLRQYKDRGESVTFVIGGAYGFEKSIAEVIPTTVCLSHLTFTHELARLVFLEQVYRAIQIQKGTGYHH